MFEMLNILVGSIMLALRSKRGMSFLNKWLVTDTNIILSFLTYIYIYAYIVYEF